MIKKVLGEYEMPMKERRVVITGLGLMTPCGQGWKSYWQAVLTGTPHISEISGFSLNGYPFKYAGEIKNFEPRDFVKQRKSLKVMSREIHLAIAASSLAVADAGLDLEHIDLWRFGISLGAGVINTELDEIGVGVRNGFSENGEFDLKKFGQSGIRSLFPLWFLKYLPNMPACHISITFGLHGPSNTITTSSAAGAQAIGEAFHLIQRGDADLMLAGSTDSKLNAMGISRFHLLNLLSQRQDASGTSYCPFDEKHDGIILGEGAGLVILEEYEHARRRGACIYGEMAGYGSSSDFNADPRTGEDSLGKQLAIKKALEDAEVAAEEIGFVCANGSAIPQEDRQEAFAIRENFRGSAERVLVTGVKPVSGHMIYGSGGVEFSAAALALQNQTVPGLINLKNPAKDCPLNFVMGGARKISSRYALFNSFGFGGQNAALVIKKNG